MAGRLRRSLGQLAAAGVLVMAVGTAAADPWDDYHILMWHPQNPAQYAALKAIGVDAGMAIWRDDDGRTFEQVVAPFRAVGIGWYAENIATDFYAAYHRWTPDKPVTWKFTEVQRRYRENPADRSVFHREPSLSDPAWLARVADRLTRVVGAARDYPALFYDLADEPGIADLAANWDFDLSPASLAGMRDWLRAQYVTLDALNRQWGTDFARWEDVMPMTTADAVARPDENFSAWADFKAWMDVAFVRALRAGTQAVHAADPRARSGIEGGQIPGWGGYDYTRLPDGVDVLEIYDFAQNVDIVHSLWPEKILLSTLGGSGPRVEHRIWSSLLRGGRGLILWDPKYGFANPDGTLGPFGQANAETFRKLRGGLGALLIGSKRRYDPVAILYAPAAFRTRWMLDIRASGQNWSDRDAEAEYADNALRAARRNFMEATVDLGLQPRFISPDNLSGRTGGWGAARVLLLPHAIALSDSEVASIRSFSRGENAVVADTMPAVFDSHSRRRPASPLADIFGTAGTGNAVLVPDASALPGFLDQADVVPKFAPVGADGRRPPGVATYTFANGDARIRAFHRAAPPNGQEGAIAMTVALPPGSVVVDLMAGASLDRRDSLDVVLDGAAPAMFAITPSATVPVSIELPGVVHRGEPVTVNFRRPDSDASIRPLHLVLLPPGGAAPRDLGNVILKERSAERPLVIAAGDVPGTWRLSVTDVLANVTQTTSFTVAQ